MSPRAKKKGFTLVELSIVMAVVIILAGVSIVTFTRVIKAAKESALMQEMKQRKEEIRLEDILHTDSDDWLSVDEFEEEIKTEIAQIKEKENIDIKEIFEDTLEEITGEYVIAALNGETEIRPSEAIYIINETVKEENDIFTEEDISHVTGRYIKNGEIKGNYSWYDNKEIMVIDGDQKQAAEEMTALSVLTRCGMDFSGKTIVLKGEIDLRGGEFTPLVSFSGEMIGEENKIIMEYAPSEATIKGMNGAVISGYMTYNPLRPGTRFDVVSYGFIGLLSEGASIKNIDFELDMKYKGSVFRNTYIGGVVGCLDGGEITDCSVTGNISGYYNVGGIVGYAKNGRIKNITAKGLTVSTYTRSETPYAGGIAGYVYSGTVSIENCSIENSKITAYSKKNSPLSTKWGKVVGMVGPLNAKTDKEHTALNITNVKYDGTRVISSTKNLFGMKPNPVKCSVKVG